MCGAAAVGCGADAEEGALAVVVSDSAGVRVVHNTGVDVQGPAEGRVSLRIGAVEGEPGYQFFRLVAVALGADGVIFAADAGHAEVRVFDADGRFVRACGGPGEGPGEFGSPGRIWLAGDTLVVLDLRLWRLTRFDAACGVLGTESVGSLGTGQIAPLRPAGGGWVVAPTRVGEWPYRPGVFRRDTTVIGFVASIPEAVAAYAAWPGPGPDGGSGSRAAPWREILSFERGRIVGVQTSRGMTATAPLFEPTPRYAVDGQGRVHFSAAGAYEIETYDVEGRLLRRVTREVPAVPVTNALVGRYRSLARAYWDTASMAGEAELGKANDEVRTELPTVPHLPPVGRLFASDAGHLWIERIDLAFDPVEREWRYTPTPPRETLWDRFDPEGRYVGAVRLQAGFTPLLVGEAWALGVPRDELGVPYIARVEVDG